MANILPFGRLWVLAPKVSASGVFTTFLNGGKAVSPQPISRHTWALTIRQANGRVSVRHAS